MPACGQGVLEFLDRRAEIGARSSCGAGRKTPMIRTLFSLRMRRFPAIERLSLLVAGAAAALVAICPGAIREAGARVIYVDNAAGDDSHFGEAPRPLSDAGGPCRTIARALRLAERGDRIVLAASGQPYRESITLQGSRHSGSLAYPFVIEGNGATLDGSVAVPAAAWEHYRADIFRFRPPRSRYARLFLDGELAAFRPPTGDGELPKLDPRQWSLAAGHVYFRVENDRLPQQYVLDHARREVGITLYEVRHVVIRDLAVQGFHLDGINAHDGVFETGFEGVTARANGRSGITVAGASRVLLRQCRLADNGVAQLRTEGYSHARLQNCRLEEGTAPALVREGGRVEVDGAPLP
jgi:hypothetical protein